MGRAIATHDIALPAARDAGCSVASLRARAGGYVVDMVIFAAIAMMVLVIAGVVILLHHRTGASKTRPTARLYTFLAIIGLGTPIVWTALNLAALATRSQTGGQYVAGVRLTTRGRRRLELPRVAWPGGSALTRSCLAGRWRRWRAAARRGHQPGAEPPDDRGFFVILIICQRRR